MVEFRPSGLISVAIWNWFRNVPYDWINKEKSNQHWLQKEGEKFLFPGGGTMFPNGVTRYVDSMVELIPGMKDGTVRTAIDTGCGVSALPCFYRRFCCCWIFQELVFFLLMFRLQAGEGIC